MTVIAGIAALAAAAFVGTVALPLGLLALAVSTVPDGDSAAALLAVGAILAALLHSQGHRAAVLGLPGAVSAAAVIAGGPVTIGRMAASLAMVGTALLLMANEPDPEAVPGPVTWAAVAAGTWLVLAPTTLPWIDAVGLGAYQAGVIRAVPVAALAVVATRLRSHGQAP